MLIKILRENKWISLFYVGNGVCQIIFASIGIVYFQKLLDQIPVAREISEVIILLLFYGGFSLLAYLLDYVDEYPMRILSNGVYQRIKVLAVEKVSRIDYATYHGLGTGSLVQMVENGADAGRKILFEFWLKIARELAPGIIITLLFIGTYDSQIMLYLGLGYLVVFAFSYLLLRYLYKLKSSLLVDQEELSRFSIRSFMELVVFRVNKRFTKELNRITSQSQRIVVTQARLRMIHELFFVLFQIIVVVVKLIIIYFGAARVFAGTASIGQIVALVTFADRIYSPIAIFNVRFIDYKLDRMTFNRFQEFMNLADDQQINQGKQYLPKTGAISFKDVSFDYGNGQLLDQLSLDIVGGTSVAFVGTSGAGKSTIVKLILGLLKPTTGQILVDGQELNSISLNDYYGHVSYVSQEAPVFDGTLRENIVFDKDVEDAEIHQILTRLHLDGLVSRLPQGLDTEVGERGTKLSGGERQRLAFARVLFQESKIVILDEPTSALDGITEEKLTAAMLELLQDRTVIIVAHRLKTVANAQEIFVIDQGKIAERGQFTELVARGGLFSSLWSTQVVDAS